MSKKQIRAQLIWLLLTKSLVRVDDIADKSITDLIKLNLRNNTGFRLLDLAG